MTDQVIARTVGALFIVGTVTAVVDGSMVLAIEDPGALSALAAQQGRVVTGALLELVLALSVLGIGALLFPVVRRRDEGLALAYAGVRTLEARPLGGVAGRAGGTDRGQRDGVGGVADRQGLRYRRRPCEQRRAAVTRCRACGDGQTCGAGRRC